MWDTVEEDFSSLTCEAFFARSLLESLNHGLLKVIPKNFAKDSIGGRVLIILLSVSYKLWARN
jgi:hypothetical protein